MTTQNIISFKSEVDLVGGVASGIGCGWGVEKDFAKKSVVSTQ